MAVTFKGADLAGSILDTAITSVNTMITNAVAGSAQATMLQQKLFDAQMAAVQHYLQVGRLQPALILAAAL
jgi:hypothetical protein